MNRLFPEIEPFERGMLDVGDGQRVYWEVCGNSEGKPAVVFHGGPGSGCTTDARRLFDPHVYRVILFDQRGAGRSTPHASDPTIDLSTNTTQHLLGDIEALREHLQVSRWLVLGGSWGSTLGLAYAQQHPERVSEMVLVGVTMSRRVDIHWQYHEVGRFFPLAWTRFRDGASVSRPDANLVDAYHALIHGSDGATRERAAQKWCDWEAACVSIDPEHKPSARYEDPAFRMAFARLVTHYFHHGVWLDEGVLLRDAHRLSGIPGVLIHGRLDLGAPLDAAWQLSRVWADSELIVVENVGHEGAAPAMRAAMMDAIARFARTG